MVITYRTCTIKDIDQLITVAKTTFTDAFESKNNPEDFKNYMTKAFSKHKIAEELIHPNSTFSFIFFDDQLAGYYKLNEEDAQKESFDKNAMELERIYIKKEFQNKKIGGAAIQHIIKGAKQKQKSALWLGVWEHNLEAIKFYKKHGFVAFGKHLFVIGGDEQYDILFKLDLT